MDKDYQDYQDFDMTGAVRGVPAHIQKLKAKQTDQISLALDEDVIAWLQMQDEETKTHINAVIRHFMAVAHA